MSEYLSDNEDAIVRKQKGHIVNSLKTLLVVAALTLVSTTLSAKTMYSSGKYSASIDSKAIKTAPVDTKQAAYDLAYSTLASLQESSPQDLNRRLSIRSFNIKSNKTHIEDNSFVTVREQMNSDGYLKYVGAINVKVHYVVRDD